MDPLHGVDMVLDLVLQYVRFRGKRVVQTVRRHAYMQQPFGVPEVRGGESVGNGVYLSV